MERVKLNTSRAMEDLVRDQIMDWEKPKPEVIGDLLGNSAPDAFDFLYELFEKKKRSDCGNPVIRHFYDVPIIIKRLRLPRLEYDIKNFNRTIKFSALHDVLEDSAKNLAELEERYEQIFKRFGLDTAKDVMHLTNIYSFIIDRSIEEADVGLESKSGLIMALNQMKNSLSEPMMKKYVSCFEKVKKIANGVTVDDVNMLKKESKLFNYVAYVKFRCYKELYIEYLVTTAKNKVTNDDLNYDIPIIIKAADGIDSLNTMNPSDQFKAGKIIKKAEIKIDAFSRFISYLKGMNIDNKDVVNIVQYLKRSLITNVKQRIISASDLEDGGYRPVEEFFREQSERLEKKYTSGLQHSFEFYSRGKD